MPKKILIVESDAALIRTLRGELEGRGFSVEDTTDGKGAQELIRRSHPDLVVLAVELSAGQNGYIICGKLRKDDELKATPVIIIGNPDGFARHKALKTRADEYVSKPVDAQVLVERVGGLIGFPSAAAPPEVVDESLSLSDLVDEEPPPSSEFQAEEISVEAPEETVHGDPELDMLDAAFDDMSTGPAQASSERRAEPEDLPVEAPVEEISALNEIEETDDDKTQIGFLPPPPPPEARASFASARGGGTTGDGVELRELKTKVTQLQGSLEDANNRLSEQESRIRELESEVESKATDLEAAKSSGGKHDKDFFSLREAANKKDKEILRLKTELNEKEKEIVELHERENTLEQQVSESSSEMARRDAQIKTLSGKTDQLSAERKKVDQQLLAAREEARSAAARLSTLEAELEQATDRSQGLEAELESKVQEAGAEADELRRELAQVREELDSVRGELADHRTQLETAHGDLDSAKEQLTSQATAFAEEAVGLRKRITEMEEGSAKYEERVTKLYGRIKTDEKVREKTKKALSIALQLLEEQANGEESNDEAAA